MAEAASPGGSGAPTGKDATPPGQASADAGAPRSPQQLKDALDQAAKAKPATPLPDMPKPGLEELVKNAAPPVDPASAGADAGKLLDSLKKATADKPPF